MSIKNRYKLQKKVVKNTLHHNRAVFSKKVILHSVIQIFCVHKKALNLDVKSHFSTKVLFCQMCTISWISFYKQKWKDRYYPRPARVGGWARKPDWSALGPCVQLRFESCPQSETHHEIRENSWKRLKEVLIELRRAKGRGW